MPMVLAWLMARACASAASASASASALRPVIHSTCDRVIRL